MAVLIICIVSLDVPLSQFLLALQKTSTRPITVARVVRWIVCPTSLSKDALLHRDSLWDLLLIFTAVLSSVPEEIDHLIRRLWMIQAYVPSRLLSSYSDGNVRLLHPLSSAIRPTTGSSSCLPNSDSNQSLKLTKELHDWIRDGHSPSGAVSMLNLLSFHPDKQEQYEAYGNPFSKSVATRGSGVAKLVGKIVPGSCSDGCDDWDTMALAHYPSLMHFADMIGSEDYQQANHRWRIPSLKDTFILCTTELDLGFGQTKAQL